MRRPNCNKPQLEWLFSCNNHSNISKALGLQIQGAPPKHTRGFKLRHRLLLKSSFLGIGAQPPMSSWGAMIKAHYNAIILGKPFLALIPGFCIMALVMAFMLIGNALRDALDVKT